MKVFVTIMAVISLQMAMFSAEARTPERRSFTQTYGLLEVLELVGHDIANLVITGPAAEKLYKAMDVEVRTQGPEDEIDADYYIKEGKDYVCTSEANMYYECSLNIDLNEGAFK